MKEHTRKISVNTISSLMLYMFIKKEENLILPIYKIKMDATCQILCQVGPKIILGAQCNEL